MRSRVLGRCRTCRSSKRSTATTRGGARSRRTTTEVCAAAPDGAATRDAARRPDAPRRCRAQPPFCFLNVTVVPP